jgi:hypothetical protein
VEWRLAHQIRTGDVIVDLINHGQPCCGFMLVDAAQIKFRAGIEGTPFPECLSRVLRERVARAVSSHTHRWPFVIFMMAEPSAPMVDVLERANMRDASGRRARVVYVPDDIREGVDGTAISDTLGTSSSTGSENV